MRSQISKPICLYVTGYLQIGTHLNIHSFQIEVLGFQTFQSELSVVWAKRNMVANKIESKRYYSPLILHSVRFLQKICVWIHKTSVSLRRFFWVPTKHCILRNIPYSESNVSYILFDICGCFDVPGFELSRFTLLLLLLKSNSVFASSTNMSKLLLLLRWFLAKMRRLWNRQTVPYYFRCWWWPWRDVFPCGSTLPFGKVRIYGDIKTSFLGKVHIKTYRFLWYFGYSCWES